VKTFVHIVTERTQIFYDVSQKKSDNKVIEPQRFLAVSEWKVPHFGSSYSIWPTRNYDRHEWSRSWCNRWQVRYGRDDRRGKSEVDSRGPHQGSSVSLGCRGWTPSKLQPIDSYELPKVRYVVLSLAIPASFSTNLIYSISVLLWYL